MDDEINMYDEQYNNVELGLNNTGYTDRICPKCGVILYNNVDINNDDYDICYECGYETRLDNR